MNITYLKTILERIKAVKISSAVSGVAVGKSLVSSENWEFCNLIYSVNRLIVTVNILLTLWLLVFRAADHESEPISFLQ